MVSGNNLSIFVLGEGFLGCFSFFLPRMKRTSSRKIWWWKLSSLVIQLCSRQTWRYSGHSRGGLQGERVKSGVLFIPTFVRAKASVQTEIFSLNDLEVQWVDQITTMFQGFLQLNYMSCCTKVSKLVQLSITQSSDTLLFLSYSQWPSLAQYCILLKCLHSRV